MIGIYRIDEDRIKLMKGGSRFELMKAVTIIYGVFLAAILLGPNSTGIPRADSVIIVSVVFAGIVALFLIINFFFKSPVYNTILEINDEGLIRTGDSLITVRLSFDEIKKIVTKPNGTILLRGGIVKLVVIHLRRIPRAYVDDPNVLFIPLAIEKYDDVISHIRQKVKRY